MGEGGRPGVPPARATHNMTGRSVSVFSTQHIYEEAKIKDHTIEGLSYTKSTYFLLKIY